MNRTGATLLFLIGGTLFNLLATGLAFVLLLVLYGASLSRILPADAAPVALIVCFVLALVLGGLAYRAALRVARSKFDLDHILGAKKQ